ncbi:MAG: cache domain-containing protein [Pseudomonadota bacterium]
MRVNPVKKITQLTLLAGLAFGLYETAYASERGNAEEAVELVKKAVTYYKVNGKKKMMEEINRGRQGTLSYKEMYLIAGNLTPSPTLAHGGNPKLINKDLTELTDVDGLKVGKRILDIANSREGRGWFDYQWPDPVANVVSRKSTYVERVDDFYIGCGIFK